MCADSLLAIMRLHTSLEKIASIQKPFLLADPLMDQVDAHLRQTLTALLWEPRISDSLKELADKKAHYSGSLKELIAWVKPLCLKEITSNIKNIPTIMSDGYLALDRDTLIQNGTTEPFDTIKKTITTLLINTPLPETQSFTASLRPVMGNIAHCFNAIIVGSILLYQTKSDTVLFQDRVLTIIDALDAITLQGDQSLYDMMQPALSKESTAFYRIGKLYAHYVQCLMSRLYTKYSPENRSALYKNIADLIDPDTIIRQKLKDYLAKTKNLKDQIKNATTIDEQLFIFFDRIVDIDSF